MSMFANRNLQRVHEREGKSLWAYARRGGDVSPYNSKPDTNARTIYRRTFSPFAFRYSFTCRMVNVLK